MFVLPPPPSHTCPSCPLIHLPEPHTCPIEINCSHSDYQEIKEQRDSYQQQLTSQEQILVQRLNTAFNLGLNSQEKNLNQVILKIQELINKPPLIITDETIQQELNHAQQTITRLEKELRENQVSGLPKMETIIQIDEKLLNESEGLKIELDKQTEDYQQLAQARNGLVLTRIKKINVESLYQLIPQVQKEEIKQAFQKVNNYQELSQIRNQLIMKNINQNSQQQQSLSTQTLPLNQERVIWIGLLVISLVGIGGLLVKLKNTNKSKSK